MNRIILMGRLVKDPEVKYTTTNKVVCQFTLAVDRPFTGQDGKREADFIQCQIWGKSAETLGNSVTKGQRILTEGRLQIRKYTDNKGVDKWLTVVICDKFEYIERKGETGNISNNAGRQQSQNGFAQTFGAEVPIEDEILF